MSSRQLVDPELLTLIETWPTFTLDVAALPILRDLSLTPLGEIANPERVEKRAVAAPGRDGAPEVPMLLYRPAGSEKIVLPCLYHIHGGGFVTGRASSLEPLHRLLVERIGCALLSVDYRLSPETSYPGPMEDCYAGLDWLFAQAGALAINTDVIGLSGESAGGGLAAGLALLVRDRAEHKLAFQHLIYPMLDDRTCVAAEPHPHTGEFIWNASNNAFGWQAYLGRQPGGEDVPSYAAAARAESLDGLPPTFLATGALDLFVEENVTYATRLIRSGVSTELHVYPGSVHAFDVAQTAAVSRQMRRDSWEFLERHLM
jgi:acetyl esterase/lipase